MVWKQSYSRLHCSNPLSSLTSLTSVLFLSGRDRAQMSEWIMMYISALYLGINIFTVLLYMKFKNKPLKVLFYVRIKPVFICVHMH